MQIRSIILYNRTGDRRILPFTLGKVNIITGESKTGKTAITDIINYCLCSRECTIPEGVIRNTVEWFSIILQLESEQVFIARKNPNFLNLESTQRVHFENYDTIKIPEHSDLRDNSDTNILKDFLSRKLLISDYSPPVGSSQNSSSVNFRHSAFYSFQPQNLIAQKNYLFYEQSDNFIAQSIKQTLPYFLGAIHEDSYRVEQLILSKKRELLKSERILSEYENIKSDGSTKLFELIDEAKQLSLLPSDKVIQSNDDALYVLNDILSWNNDTQESIEGEDENLKKLLDERIELIVDLGIISDEIKSVSLFINQASEYSDEMSQHKARLESINLYQDSDVDLSACPLCNQHLDNEIPSISAIKKSLSQLTNSLATTRLEPPKLTEYSKGLVVKQTSIKNRIEIIDTSIRAIYKEKEEAQKLKDLNIRKGKIIGKVSLFLESFDFIKEDGSLKERIAQLKMDILELEDKISEQDKANRLEIALRRINAQMTSWAKELDLEYPEASIRFDIKRLTIFADTPDRSIPLNHMGSGANWLSCHLLIHFALHKYFIKENRPVPRFLVIDQPSQIYFPPEKDTTKTGMILESSDEIAVKNMYNFIIKITNELSPHFQVIITDHAKLKFSDFEESIIEEWRDGNKLIPDSWISS